MRSLPFKETAFGLGSRSLASNGETSKSCCSPRARVSRRIERFFCAKGATTPFVQAQRWNERCGGAARRAREKQSQNPHPSKPRVGHPNSPERTAPGAPGSLLVWCELPIIADGKVAVSSFSPGHHVRSVEIQTQNPWRPALVCRTPRGTRKQKGITR
jgi:hypothetical protein